MVPVEKIAERVGEELKQVRLVHLSLVVVCCTLLYLVAAGWNSAPEARRELLQLARQIDNLGAAHDLLAEGSGAGANNFTVVRFKLGFGVNFDSAIRDQLIEAVEIDSPPSLPTSDARCPFPQGASPCSLEALLAEIATRPIAMTVFGRIDFKEPIPARWKICPLTLEKITYQPGADPSEGQGQATFVKNCFNNGWVASTVLNFFTRSSIPFTVRKRKLNRPLGPAWWRSHFAFVDKDWDQLKGKTVAEADAWEDKRRTESLGDGKIKLFDIEVAIGRAGWAGPVAVAAILFLLAAMLEQLLVFVRRSAGAPHDAMLSPWVATMSNSYGVFARELTLAALPVAAVFFALARLAGLRWWLALPPALLVGWLGLKTIDKSRELASWLDGTAPAEGSDAAKTAS